MADSPGKVKWIIANDENSITSTTSEQQIAAPKYSAFGERIRHVTPHGLTCSMFCGGKQCKYCVPGKFKDEEMIIKGLYSSWVTENILAMSRPATELIKKYNIIEQFQKNGIKAVINLQLPGEHAACGFGLEPGGFSYVPQEFMDNDVFFYNFGWNDYGVRSLQAILDMVKVMDFAISNGKVSVHCHAGLGRTGVLIACYLIYSERISPDEAILTMRQTRPKAIQTRGQVNCVKDFAAYLKPMWTIFPSDDKLVTLPHQMSRQRHLLHGEEARTLKHIPKILFIICRQLLKLADVDYDLCRCARITYSFMRNSKYNSVKKKKKNSTTTNTSMKNENKDDFNLHKVHSTTDLDKEAVEYDSIQSSNSLKPLSEQFKALSTPNVFLKGESLNDEDEGLNTKLQKKSILKPIKMKKKKGLKDRLAQLKDSPHSESNMMNASFDSAMLSSLQRESLNSSLDARLTQRRRSDLASISSFSGNNELSPPELVLKYLAFRTTDITVSNQIERYKYKLNSSEKGWSELSEETSLPVLCGLLWSWFSQLHSPVVSIKTIEVMGECIDNPEECFGQLDRDVWKLMECFITFLSKIEEKPYLVERILRRFAILMTGDESIPRISAALEPIEEECSPGVVFLQFSSAWLSMLNSTDS